MGTDLPPPRPVAVAFCPHPPLLLPALEGHPDPETDVLRAACSDAVHTMLDAAPDTVLIVGDGPAGSRYGVGDAGDLQPYGGRGQQPFSGTARRDGAELPLPHLVAAWLLDEVGFSGTRLGTTPDGLAASFAGLPGTFAVLAMGDGSARRTEKAPGHLDPAAGAYDRLVSSALASGDAAALAALDPDEGGQLLAGGTATWRELGRLLQGWAPVPAMLYDAAPYGVGYLVASWTHPDHPDGNETA